MIQLLTAGLLLIIVGNAVSADPVVVTVDQISDPLGQSASAVFRFDPAFLHLPDDGKIVFRNSVGGQTVHTIRGLWPDGAARL